MTRVRALVTLLILVACNGRPQSGPAAASGHVATDHPEVDTANHSTLQPGFYAAPWNDGYGSRWLALYVSPSLEVVTYVDAEVNRLCSLKVWGDSVRFTTGTLPFWQTGDRFTFAFRGVRTSTGMMGEVLMNGAPYDRKVFPTQFRFYATSPITPNADTSLEGLYGLVHVNQETGDVLGDELLLVNTTRGLVAFYTDYEGVPTGPFPSDAISIHHDTVTVDLPLFAPDRSTPITFIIRHPTLRATTDDPLPGNISDPRYVAKRASVADVFATSGANGCVAQDQRKSGG